LPKPLLGRGVSSNELAVIDANLYDDFVTHRELRSHADDVPPGFCFEAEAGVPVSGEAVA